MWELGSDADDPEWQEIESPFKKTIYEVVSTSAGPYAIGDGGTLLANRDGDWEVILNDGPRTRDNQLRGLDVTDDGERVWFAGSSGALGCYDVQSRKKFDYSNPKEMTSTWEGLAVAGQRGSEKVLVANGSGEIMPFTVDGFDENWGVVSKPAKKGSKVAALAASPDGFGYAIDTSGNAFKTTKEDGWKDIGIVNAQVKFYDIYAGKNKRVYVAAGDGRIYRYDDSYHDWTPIGVTDKNSLRAFDVHGDQMVAMGNGGRIFQRTDDQRWEEVHAPTGNTLNDLALGDPDVAVGASGTILQRLRGKTRHSGKSKDGDEFDGRGEYDDGDENPKDGGSGDGGSGSGDSSGSGGSSGSGDSSGSGGSSGSGDSSGSSGSSDSGGSGSGDSSSSGSSSDSDGSAGSGGSSGSGSSSSTSGNSATGDSSSDGTSSSDGSAPENSASGSNTSGGEPSAGSSTSAGSNASDGSTSSDATSSGSSAETTSGDSTAGDTTTDGNGSNESSSSDGSTSSGSSSDSSTSSDTTSSDAASGN